MIESKLRHDCFQVRGVTLFYRVLALLIAAFFSCIGAVSLAVWVKNGHIVSLISWIPLLWLCYAALSVFLLRKFFDIKRIGAVIFTIALLPRLALALAATYTPTSDFANYWDMGQMFLIGNHWQVAEMVDHYRVFEFSFMSILVGIQQWVSGSSMMGLQILQSLYTAGIASALYHLGKQYNKHIALAAALLFALYPSNIVMTQVNTNQHLSTLMALIALLCFMQGLRKNTILPTLGNSALSALFLLVSHFLYPSSMITRIALAVYIILLILEFRHDREKLLRMAVLIVAFLALFAGGKALINQGMLTSQYRYDTTEEFHHTERILTGLTVETDGQLDEELRESFVEMTEQERIQAILEKFEDPVSLAALMARKALRMWGAMDSSFVWYTAADDATDFQLAVSKALGALDMLYVGVLYLLAAIGLFLSRNRMRRLSLPLLIIAGWICVYLLYEIQARYRYYAMPFLFLFAAIGGVSLWRHLRKKVHS